MHHPHNRKFYSLGWKCLRNFWTHAGHLFLSVWETLGGRFVVQSTDSVVILPYIAETGHVVMVEQLRPAMIHPLYNPTGRSLEFPAGRLDHDGTPAEIAITELQEECGITEVDVSDFELVDTVPNPLNPGLGTERSFLYFVKIRPDQLEADRVFGEAHEGEEIKRILIPIWELDQLHGLPATGLALINWFLRNRAPEPPRPLDPTAPYFES